MMRCMSLKIPAETESIRTFPELVLLPSRNKMGFAQMTFLKSQIPNPKSQIISKLQFPITKTVLFGISNFDYWSLFGIWCLPVGRGFGAF
jgi:hypothetical protein